MAKKATVEIDIETDSSKAVDGFDDAARAADRLASAVDDASRSVDTGADRMAGAADAADNLDSKSAQATGSLGALSSGFELIGAEDAAAGLQSAAMATDFMAGVGEGLNLILELQAVQWVKNKVATAASTVATKAQAAATKAAAIAQRILNVAMRANPIGLIIAGVTLLVGGFILLYKRSETFRRIVDKLWASIKTGVQAAARILKAVFSAAWRILGVYVRTYWSVVQTVFNTLRNVTRTVAAAVKNAFITAWDAIKTAVRTITGVVRTVTDTVKTVFTNAWDAIQTAFDTVWEAIQTALDWDPAAALKKAWGGVQDVLTAPFKAAKKIIEGIADGLSGVFDGALDGLTSTINKVIEAINSAINAFNKLPGPDIPTIPTLNASSGGTSPAVAVARYSSPGITRLGAPAAAGVAPGGVVININNAVDPEGTARAVARVMRGHQRRIGLATA